VPPCLAFWSLILGSFAVPAPTDWLGVWSERPLTTAQQVRNLCNSPAKIGGPLKLRGVVTHVDPGVNDFWIQDATAGIYVHSTPDAANLVQGDRVEVEGVSEKGAFSPCVLACKVTRLGKGTLPDPVPCNLSYEDSRWQDGQWVQAWVIGRGAYIRDGMTRVEVFTAKGIATLVIPGEYLPSETKPLRDAAITVRGVCVPTFKDGMVSGPPKILLTELPRIADIGPDVDGPEAPPRLIEHWLRFIPTPHTSGWRIKIGGVVTASPLPGIFIVQDSTGGAIVWAEDANCIVPVGTRVEAVGVLELQGQQLSLRRAKIKNLGQSALPEAVAVDPGELSAQTHTALLGRLSARVEEVHPVGNWTAVTLVDGAHRFEAYAPGLPAANGLGGLEAGSRVEVAGVPIGVTPDAKPPARPGLFLRGAEAMTLLEPPPRATTIANQSWWNTTRVAYLTIGFLIVAVLGGAWLWTLRVRVSRATGEVQQQFDEKAKLEKQLRQAAKLEAVGRLAGGLAHDFNNLLTVINGCAELLADETGQHGRLAELTDDIRRAGERAAALTGQLLTFSRKRDILISAVNINEVVTDTARLLDRVIGEDIRIEITLSPNLPAVQAEPGLLHQVIMNLAVNARDAMPRGGTLSLSTAFVIDAGDMLGGTVVPVGSAPRKYVRLVVSDTGVGMSEDVKARVFEPFFTTKEIGKGTGLGLATVYGVVQSLSGRIQVISAVGKGTTFQIDLRVHGDPISDADITLPPVNALAGGGASSPLAGTTVLVVEDDEMVRNTLITGLTSDGATVLAAEHPDRALRILSEHPGAIDVLVTDVVMPGMSGRELADRMRIARPSMEIVFMSGYNADEVLRQGVLEDQVEFLQKPFTPDNLTMRLLRVLGRT
jgi:two-component system, cell cycle sensor histidine kinase and response regulator CckA